MPVAPLSAEELNIICSEMDQEIQELVAAQSTGRINEKGFVEALLKFEAARAAALGLIVTASHTFDNWTVISLRIPGRSEPCASFEFQPTTGLFRHVGSPCRAGDAATPEKVVD